MSTYMPKPDEIKRNWYILDAAGKPFGKVATQAAVLLRGKHKPIFTPHVDCGDHVIIINASEAVLTGKKDVQKKYYHHTGYIGNMKEVSYGELLEKKPAKAFELAVGGMIPKNTQGRNAMTRLRVYGDAEHQHQAQQPEIYEF